MDGEYCVYMGSLQKLPMPSEEFVEGVSNTVRNIVFIRGLPVTCEAFERRLSHKRKKRTAFP
jgi:hypothetical protein